MKYVKAHSALLFLLVELDMKLDTFFSRGGDVHSFVVVIAVVWRKNGLVQNSSHNIHHTIVYLLYAHGISKNDWVLFVFAWGLIYSPLNVICSN